MLFQRKIDRVLDSKSAKEEEESKKEEREKIELEKNDLKAIFLAAFITLGPAILVIAAIFVAVIWFMFLR